MFEIDVGGQQLFMVTDGNISVGRLIGEGEEHACGCGFSVRPSHLMPLCPGCISLCDTAFNRFATLQGK